MPWWNCCNFYKNKNPSKSEYVMRNCKKKLRLLENTQKWRILYKVVLTIKFAAKPSLEIILIFY